MPDDFPELRDGDVLEPFHINILNRENMRWRRLSGIPPVSVEGADGEGGPVVRLTESPPFFIQLTGPYSSGYPWKEVYVLAGRSLQDSGFTGSVALGNPAFELQTGDTTLTAGATVYQARPSPASGQILFDGKN